MRFIAPWIAKFPTLPRDRVVWIIAGLTGVLHLALAGRYDFFRNELYFIICGRHPAFGYVDQPPLVPLLSAATQIFGPNPWLLRLPAALAAVALIPLTASFARLLGAGPRSAQLAAAAAALAPGLAALTATFTTSSFEAVAWTACAWLLARAALQQDHRALIKAGLVIGVSMQAKFGIGIWLLGLAGGILATPARRMLRLRQGWVGAALALLLAAPPLLWQSLRGWPFFTVVTAPMTAGGDFLGSPWRFVIDEAIAMNPLLAPLWGAGLLAPLILPRLRGVAFLPLAVLLAGAIDYVSGGKGYYFYPAFPTLFALGAAAWPAIGPRTMLCFLAPTAAVAALLAPMALPILDPPALQRYLDRTHLRPRPIEKASIGAPLTHLFSDEMGWRDLERKVAAQYQALPEPERRKAAIIASNYGEAGAIDLFGAADGLPPALSGQNHYFLWGPRGFDGSVIIHINGDPERWRRICSRLDIVDSFGAPYAMPYETGRPIFICRGLRTDLAQLWPRLQRYQ